MADASNPPAVGYRPIPVDFVEIFVRVGWDGIEAEVRAHKTTIVRWIEIHDAGALAEGRPVLNVLRREWLERKYAATGKRVFGRKPGQSRAARYTPARPAGYRWPCRAPRFWDVGLVPLVEAGPAKRRIVRRVSAERAARIVEESVREIDASPEFLAGMAKAVELIRAAAMEGLK
jgi:hypothetical protein